MEAIIRELIKAGTEDVLHELKKPDFFEKDFFKIYLDAYNTYQELECNGVGYIFNLFDQDDLRCCVKGGLKAKEIADLYNGYKIKEYTPMFLFGQNHQQPKLFASFGEVRDYVSNYAEEIVTQTLAYPQAYKELYDWFFTTCIENNILK